MIWYAEASKKSGDLETIITSSPVRSLSLLSPTRHPSTISTYLSIKSAAETEPWVSVRAVYPDKSAIRMAIFSSIECNLFLSQSYECLLCNAGKKYDCCYVFAFLLKITKKYIPAMMSIVKQNVGQ